MIRAKFRCQHVTNHGDSEAVRLHAVSDKLNEQWAKWTPGGTLDITISNPEARGRFEPGKYYYLDFSPAD